MEITWKEKGDKVIFLINTSNENYRTALRKLQYPEFKEGFGRTFSKDILNLKKYFERFKEIAEEMIKQTVKEVSVPWEKALLAFLKIIDSESLHWWVTGSCALTLYGVEIIPRDIDLVTDSKSALKLGKLLEDYVYEPVTDTSGWFCKWFGRAFLHMRIEWIGGVYEDESLQIQKDFGYIAEKQLRFINWNNHRIKVPPLKALLEQTVKRGLNNRAEKIKKIL
ncbi:MAG: hypothetical protein JSW11_17095 [Candidatus Heimdallarchaeota archaeon]|nr:MAG: hypothetical protein JSW11_17095 [Candidatus Heimdallarchaeota archaeon]